MFPENPAVVKTKDINAWRQIVEGRAGALASIAGFLTDCKELATMDVVKLIAKCLTTAVKLMADIPPSKKSLELGASTTKMRTQLYGILYLLPVNLYVDPPRGSLHGAGVRALYAEGSRCLFFSFFFQMLTYAQC